MTNGAIMQIVMILYKRIYMTALAAVLMFCLATTAKAGQFDYDAAMAKVTSEIYSKKYIEAFNTIKEIGRNATKSNNIYGKYLFYSATAKLYNEQGDYVQAEMKYRMAIDIANNNTTDIDVAGAYHDLARCLDKQTRRNEAVDVLMKGLENTKSETSRAQLRILLGKLLFWEKRYDDFRTYFKQAEPYFNKEISSDNSAYLKAIIYL